MKINNIYGNYNVSALTHKLSQCFANRSTLKLFAAGALLSSGLFLSCSEDTEILEPEQNLSLNQQEFTLVPNPVEPERIVLSKSTSDKSDTSKKAEADRGRFNISFRYLTNLTPRQLEVFESAKARWERIIIKDVPSITGEIPSAFGGVPPIEGTIDDIVIEVVVAPIDGPGQILGQAGPRYLRTADRLPLSGVMYFDVEDLDFLDELNLFEDVIVHEMGHVLGVGTLWNYYRSLREGPNSNPYFTGHMANVHWGAEGGTNALPIENQGGGGTALSHWRESILQNELMTGYINLGENPLSRITAGSLKDLGYGAAVVGEQYFLPKGTEGVVVNSTDEISQGESLHIAAREILLEPVGYVTTEK